LGDAGRIPAAKTSSARLCVPLLLLPFIPATAVAVSPEPRVLVDVVKGVIAQGERPLHPGDFVVNDLPIVLGANSWAALFAAPGCVRTTLRGPGTFRRVAAGIVDDRGRVLASVRLTGCDAEGVAGEVSRRLTRAGAVVVRDLDGPARVLGLPGDVLTPRPSLRVALPSRSHQKGRLAIRHEGQVVAQAEFDDAHPIVAFPSEATSLRPGMTYFVDLEIDAEEQRTYLRTIPAAEAAELAQLGRALAGADGAPSLLFAKLLVDRGLVVDVLDLCGRIAAVDGGWVKLCPAPASTARPD
jgi:hypothetical protein